jgi:hypothetical protein
VKRDTLLRRGLSAAAAALWLEELAEAVTGWRGISPAADHLLDRFTVALTVIVGLWMVHEHYARIHADIRRRDQQVADLSNFANIAVQRLETGEPRNAPALRPVNGKGRLG